MDEAQINSVKQAYIERIGAECLGMDVPFFLEPLVYDEAIGDEKGLAFASKKPETAHGTPKFTGEGEISPFIWPMRIIVLLTGNSK